MDARALNEAIGQGIRKVYYPDRIELYLPFFLGNEKSEELCLSFDRDGVLSDGGRTLEELKKRVGDLAPYRETIRNILDHFGTVALEGGQKLVVRSFQTCSCGDKEYLDYAGGLSRMIRVIALICAADRIKVDEDGVVSLC